MRRLPQNYSITKYGLFARLVEESDAEFIYQLRSDPKLSKFVHKVSGGIENQKQWIKEYKKREEEGSDYYFIFFKDNKPVGLNRLYNLTNDSFQSGSWLFSKDAPFGAAFLAQIMLREIAFLEWGYEYEDSPIGVHVDNTNVLKFDILSGMHETGRYYDDEEGEYISLGLTKENFIKGRNKVLRLLGIKDVEI